MAKRAVAGLLSQQCVVGSRCESVLCLGARIAKVPERWGQSPKALGVSSIEANTEAPFQVTLRRAPATRLTWRYIRQRLVKPRRR